jgi:hypothetical protein
VDVGEEVLLQIDGFEVWATNYGWDALELGGQLLGFSEGLAVELRRIWAIEVVNRKIYESTPPRTPTNRLSYGCLSYV